MMLKTGSSRRVKLDKKISKNQSSSKNNSSLEPAAGERVPPRKQRKTFYDNPGIKGVWQNPRESNHHRALTASSRSYAKEGKAKEGKARAQSKKHQIMRSNSQSSRSPSRCYNNNNNTPGSYSHSARNLNSGYPGLQPVPPSSSSWARRPGVGRGGPRMARGAAGGGRGLSVSRSACRAELGTVTLVVVLVVVMVVVQARIGPTPSPRLPRLPLREPWWA